MASEKIWLNVVENEDVGNLEHVTTMADGTEIYLHGRSLVVRFPDDDRTVLSSSAYNGGVFRSPSAVVNTTGLTGEAEAALMYAGREAHKEYYSASMKRIGLDPETIVGLGTAVTMDKAAIVTMGKGPTEVTAIVTAGVEGNGGRAGDPCSYDESEGFKEQKHGTIVIILLINARLTVSTMARAIMTATEAKTCALQQLMARSLYSHGIATGSGTDQIAIVSNDSSELTLNDAGKHSCLGELIGRSVIRAVTEALDKWAKLNPVSQRNAMKRLMRYGITESTLTERAKSEGINPVRFSLELSKTATDERIVALTGCILHIQDEMEWGLISKVAGLETGHEIIRTVMHLDYEQSDNLAEDLGLVIYKSTVERMS